MSYLADVGALARKDLLLELRSRDTLPAMLLFVLSSFVVFHFVLPTGTDRLAAQGLLWVAIVFTALLGLARAFSAEREQSVLDGLVLATRDLSAIWFGKALSILAFLALAEVVARLEQEVRERTIRQTSTATAGLTEGGAKYGE